MLDLVLYAPYAASARFAARLAATQRYVAQALVASHADLSDWGVSLSLGKDSLILYHLLTQIGGRDVPAAWVTSSESWLLHDYARVLLALHGRGLLTDLTILATDHAAPDGTGRAAQSWGATAATAHAAHDLPRQVAAWATARGLVGSWIGMRAQENPKRRGTALRTVYGGPGAGYCYRTPAGRWHACPLAEWTLEDLGAYAWQHRLPLLNAYQTGGLGARTTARLSAQVVTEFAGVAALKAGDLAHYNALIQLFPELAAQGG